MNRFNIYEDYGVWTVENTKTNVKYDYRSYSDAFDYVMSWFETTLSMYKTTTDDMLTEVQRLRAIIDAGKENYNE
jgi:hypothetical protein